MILVEEGCGILVEEGCGNTGEWAGKAERWLKQQTMEMDMKKEPRVKLLKIKGGI